MVGLVLMEVADEWQVTRRYFIQESMRKLTDPDPLVVSEPAPFRWRRCIEETERASRKLRKCTEITPSTKTLTESHFSAPIF